MDGIVALALILNISLPPNEYDRPYTGNLFVIEAGITDVHKQCGSPPGPRVFACAMPGLNYCIIVMPRVENGGVTPQQYERLKRHEIGHCNGWPGHHPHPIWD